MGTGTVHVLAGLCEMVYYFAMQASGHSLPATRAVTRVSVVIPVHIRCDRSNFLLECLDSVFSQTLLPDEVILVDDASPVPVAPLLGEYGSRVQVISLERNQGVGEARNVGWRASRNEWIAFLDCDDLWMPDKLERQCEYLNANRECDAVYGGMLERRQDGREGEWGCDRPNRIATADVFLGWVLFVPTVLISKSALERVGGFQYRGFMQDMDLAFHLATAGIRVEFLPGPPLSVYRKHGSNTILQTMRMLKCHLEILWEHRRDFWALVGFRAWLWIVGRALRTWGRRTHGLKGRAIGISGRLVQLLGRATEPGRASVELSRAASN